MSRHNMLHSSRLFRSATSAGILLLTGLLAFPAAAQSANDPVEFGAAQLPYVMILMDTSASMEWTDKGDAAYPELKHNGTPRETDSWKPGTDLNIHAQGHPQVDTIGPCYVWRPQCNGYERPSWCANGDCGVSNTGIYNSNSMYTKIDQMRESTSMRLADDNMPRHVMIKEILAGDMMLRSKGPSGDPDSRPGCWFVPRFKSAALDKAICASSSDFSDLIDADDPRPHIQEVYDERANNGLLERMSNTVLLGVTMFDGYQYDGRKWGMDDILAGQSPLKEGRNSSIRPTGSPASQTEDLYSGLRDSTNNYNLGIYRVVGPSSLKAGLTETRAIARHVQHAIADAGYISKKSGGSYTLTPGSSVENYLEPYLLAKQPMAGATPLAAAMHDIYQYFLHGQYKEKQDWSLGTHARHENVAINPFGIDEDLHRSCRPKHVIILTDGYPEPEAPGGAGNGVGSENMNAGFGYNLDQYPYGLTEDLIEQFVTDENLGVDPADPKYGKHAPRVHIIGVNVADGVASNQGPIAPENSKEVLTKLAVMAERGNTCAQYYLPINMLPEGVETGMPRLNADGSPQSSMGECRPDHPDPTKRVCLEKQHNLSPPDSAYPGYVYYPNGTNSAPFNCQHPALIFNQNDKATIRAAFQAVFNEIISTSGMAARTRPSMTSYLDVDTPISGQYRMYSGVKMEGGSPFWKGILNQESLQCGPEGELAAPPVTGSPLGRFRSLSNEISYLRLSKSAASANNPVLNPEKVDADRRRVFTMVPNPNWYDFEKNRAKANPLTNDGRAVSVSSIDEFGSSYIADSAQQNSDPNKAAVGIRIPVEHSTLRKAFIGDNKPFATDNVSSFYKYLNIPNANDHAEAKTSMEALIDEVRGRSASKFDRVLGGIFQSNPVTVGPPDLAVPIDSYRDFRARYSDRPTMLYVGTLDGQLHAIYTGQPDVYHRKPTLPDNAGGANNDDPPEPKDFHQREAWSYIPHMLLGELQLNANTQPRLLDGTPVVSDVRLCNASGTLNRNKQACVSSGDNTMPGNEQWRTVLVQGLGDAGRGYFALDVTRTGDKSNPPDPIPLWEFNDKWEFGQLKDSTSRNLFGYHSTNGAGQECQNVSQLNGDKIDEWKLPFMGSSVGEAAIGTVAIGQNRHAVAVFTAGMNADADTSSDKFGNCSGANRVGRAIYVVDLQSGEMLRRFVDFDNGTQFANFPSDMVGTPALFDDFPGSLVTRGFVGDAAGALYRIDLSGRSPADWKVTQFFNPSTYPASGNVDLAPHDQNVFGPAAFRPALAMNTDRKLVVVYGLGSRGDTDTNNQTQFIIALEEKIDEIDGQFKVVANPLWAEKFDPREKLTGEPVVFNNGVYFTTYHKSETQDACEPGYARIYGLGFQSNNYTSVGLWPEITVVDGEIVPDDQNFIYDPAPIAGMRKWFGPSEPTLIRGVAITMGASCSDAFDEDGQPKPFAEEPAKSPQLVAQTGSATGNQTPGSGGSAGGTGGSNLVSDKINTIAVDLDRPRSQSIPLSWTVITN